MPPFHLVNVTWGENHTGLFLDVSLPTQLLPNNLPVLAERPDTIYKIYAPAEDAARIRGNAGYHRLCAMMVTQIIEVDIGGAAAHDVLTECQKQAIREAEAVGAAIIFLAPDTALADGAFATLARLADLGKKAVMVPGVRLAKESFVPAFIEKFQRHDYGLTDVGPRDLVMLALDHLHPTAKALFWPAKVNWPSNLYWSVGREGFLCRCFHLHPMMVVTSQRNVSFASTIDGDYVEQACADRDQIHIVEDSDELTIFEISSVRHCVGRPVRRPLRAHAVGRWGARFANNLHRRMFGYTTRIHSVVCSPLWETVQAQSDVEVHSTFGWLKCYDAAFRAVAPAMPTIRWIAGRNALARRALRPVYRFAVKLVTRGPRKALRLTKEFLGLQPATPPAISTAVAGSLTAMQHSAAEDKLTAPQVDCLSQPTGDGKSSHLETITNPCQVDPTRVPPHSLHAEAA